MLLPSPESVRVPVRLPFAGGLHRHTLPCATFQVSSHCWCVEFFDIGCWQNYGPSYSCCQCP
ncbi:unnamed protein product [Staurois parvus]|uniref:Uncharacterized protein n=1 Tax=Staurois parvus TaxID=386267 RepID=A0ABN9BV79_9NEOB|nr:unnamed protein product [Staurois parvus]